MSFCTVAIVSWKYTICQFSSVHFSCSVVYYSLWPHGPQHASTSLSITNSRSSLKLISSESVMPSNHLILCHPLLLLPSIFPSIRVSIYSKYWGFSDGSASKELACQCRRCEMRVLSLGQEDPLEKKMATRFSILACRIPWTEAPGRLQSLGMQSRTQLSACAYAHSRYHWSKDK